MRNLLEVDLYQAVKDYFSNRGYDVKGEVKDCDVVAIRDDDFIVIEMKTKLNLDVILQATIRQKLTKTVYIAVPKLKREIRSKRWRNIMHLLKRLNIGLLVVSSVANQYFVEALSHPVEDGANTKLASKKRKQVLTEFNERHGDYNQGGVTRTKLITAYKEKTIQIAVLLRKHGELSTRDMRQQGTDQSKTTSILQDNYYGWFKRVKHGVYAITEQGIKELEDYPQLVELFLNENKK
jgi:hypothetical protein